MSALDNYLLRPEFVAVAIFHPKSSLVMTFVLISPVLFSPFYMYLVFIVGDMSNPPPSTL